MPGRVSAQLNPADVARATLMLRGVRDGVDRAQTRALNNTAKKARTKIITESRADINLKAAFLRARILGPNERAGNNATFAKKEAKVTASRRGLVLSHFLRSTRTNLQTVNGRLRAVVEVKVKSSGRSIAMRSAFLMRLRRGTASGNTYGVFQRPQGGGKPKHLYGPSPSQIMNQEIPVLSPNFQRDLERQTDQEIVGLLRQYGR